MWHKPCRTFHLWCLCIKTRCLSAAFLSSCLKNFNAVWSFDCLIPKFWDFLRSVPDGLVHRGSGCLCLPSMWAMLVGAELCAQVTGLTWPAPSTCESSSDVLYIILLPFQESFWVWVQPMRDKVTLYQQHLSLAEPIPRMIPVYYIGYMLVSDDLPKYNGDAIVLEVYQYDHDNVQLQSV